MTIKGAKQKAKWESMEDELIHVVIAKDEDAVVGTDYYDLREHIDAGYKILTKYYKGAAYGNGD